MPFPYEVIGTPNVPDRTGVGGVLSVFKENGALNCSWEEVAEAFNHGWLVAVFDGSGSYELAGSATVDNTGETPVYQIVVGETTYSCDSASGVPESGGSGGDDNLVGSAIVGTAKAGGLEELNGPWDPGQNDTHPIGPGTI